MSIHHRRAACLLPLVVFAAALFLAGCGSDSNTKTTPAPATGPAGTALDPFVMAPGDIVSGIAIPVGGKIFFRMDGLTPQTMYSVRISSVNDDELDLVLNYNDAGHVFEACKPAFVGAGEECWFVTDVNMGTVFGHVDGIAALAADTLTIEAAIGFQFTSDLAAAATRDLWGYAPVASSLSGALNAATVNFMYQVFDSAATPVLFTGNVTPNQCDVNIGATLDTATCTVALSGSAPHRFTVTNNGTLLDTFTLILNFF